VVATESKVRARAFSVQVAGMNEAARALIKKKAAVAAGRAAAKRSNGAALLRCTESSVMAAASSPRALDSGKVSPVRSCLMAAKASWVWCPGSRGGALITHPADNVLRVACPSCRLLKR